MKVKELIKQLEQYDPEARVYSDCWMGEGKDEILCSIAYADNGDVILENAHQFDMKEKIGAMLDYYNENYYDEVDAYQEMCDRGYTPDIVSKYYDEYTGECMKEYCDEHGIDY